jgi:adenylosuccinate synthase
VLSGLDTLKLCIAYETREGERLRDLPDNQTVFHSCQPVYEEIAGWDEDITTVTELEGLPPRAQAYVDRITLALGVPITLIGTGQGRHQVIDHVGI